MDRSGCGLNMRRSQRLCQTANVTRSPEIQGTSNGLQFCNRLFQMNYAGLLSEGKELMERTLYAWSATDDVSRKVLVLQE